MFKNPFSRQSTETRPRVFYEQITFTDETAISLSESDIVVFIGPNNVGKSVALRALWERFAVNAQTRVITNSKPIRTGTDADVYKLIESNARRIFKDTWDEFSFEGYGFSLLESSMRDISNRELRHFRGVFCTLLGTVDRIRASDPPKSISILDEAPSHPNHLLFLDEELETELSALFRSAFACDLRLFYGAGGVLPLFVGEFPQPSAREGRHSVSHMKRMRDVMAPLHEQGDGMRSFASVLLHLFAPLTQSLVLLDEPEAFLHPSQAQLLGQIIASKRRSDVQLFVATHSSDVLRGLLAVDSANLKIVRIDRDGAVNQIHVLDKEAIGDVAANPILNYSNILDAPFHKRTIIAESDVDCLFYSSILRSTLNDEHPDVLFTHANGKHRIKRLASISRSLGVSVDVIVDIDILQELNVLRELFIELGGDWESIRHHATEIKKAVDSRRPELTPQEFRSLLMSIAQDVSKTTVTAIDRALSEGLKETKPWIRIKEAGKSALTAGEITQQYEALDQKCKDVGLWIVSVGELEGFWKRGRKGPDWIQQVLIGRDLATDPELSAAREFVLSIWRRS